MTPPNPDTHRTVQQFPHLTGRNRLEVWQNEHETTWVLVTEVEGDTSHTEITDEHAGKLLRGASHVDDIMEVDE